MRRSLLNMNDREPKIVLVSLRLPVTMTPPVPELILPRVGNAANRLCHTDTQKHWDKTLTGKSVPAFPWKVQMTLTIFELPLRYLHTSFSMAPASLELIFTAL